MKINIVDVKVSSKDELTKRVRKSKGSLFELAASIEKHGLMHPIVIDKLENGKYKWILIAGERRLKAAILTGASKIDATLFSDVDDVGKKEMELEENLLRKQLDWPEQVKALAQIDKLKRKIYGGATRAKGNEGWGIKETAEALGMSIGAVGQDIQLAKNIENRPDLLKKVRRMPKSAARKIVNQTLHTEHLKKQLDVKEITISSDIRLGRCEDLIDELKDNSVDLLITDPPFAVPEIVDVAGSGASTMTYNVTESNVSTPDVMLKTYEELIPKLFNKMKPAAHIYIFLGMGWYPYLTSKLRQVGFIVDDLPIIWDKGRPSIMAKDIHYMSCYEAILFGHKPPKTNLLRHPTKNVLSIPAIPPQQRVHGLQKPFDLLKILIENSSSPGETVLDCFVGSGATIKAAKQLQRSAIGFELDDGNFLRAQKFVGE